MRYAEIVVESAGRIIAYHGSLGPISGRFHAFTHFGSRAAAEQRIRDSSQLDPAARPYGMKQGDPVIYKVSLAIHKPLMIEDGWQNADDEAKGLRRLGHITDAEMARIIEGKVDAVDVVKARGYDSYVYRNAWEDAGSLSYVPFTDEQITILDVTPP
jgi:hypothetical protein